MVIVDWRMGVVARPSFILAAAMAAVLLSLMPARADDSQTNANMAWKQGDACARAAFKKFPDYTAESNAKREAARRTCLRNHRLPEPAPEAGNMPPLAPAAADRP